jgi:hypothetical protein
MSFVELVIIVIGTPSLTLSVGRWLFSNFIKKHIDYIYAKALEDYKVDRQQIKDENLKEFQKNLDIIFRNENVRTSVVSSIIATGDKERIRIFHRAYMLLFKINQSRSAIKDKSNGQAIKNELENEIEELRTDIMVNWIYLGKLTDHLLDAQDGLWEDLHAIGNDGQINPSKYKSSMELWKAAQWIRENMGTHLTLNCVDLPESINDKLREESNKRIVEYFEDNSNDT